MSRFILLTITFFTTLSLTYFSQNAYGDSFFVIGGKQTSFRGTLYQTIPFSSFMPNAENVNYTQPWDNTALGHLRNDTFSRGIFNAPVILPDGVVVSRISLSASDVNDGGNILVCLQKFSFDDGAPPTIIPADPPNVLDSAAVEVNRKGVVSLDVNDEIIDNQSFYYSLNAVFNGFGADRLHAVRITYRLP